MMYSFEVISINQSITNVRLAWYIQSRSWSAWEPSGRWVLVGLVYSQRIRSTGHVYCTGVRVRAPLGGKQAEGQTVPTSRYRRLTRALLSFKRPPLVAVELQWCRLFAIFTWWRGYANASSSRVPSRM